MKIKFTAFLLLFVFSNSLFAQTMPQGADPKLWAEALKIHKKAIVIDGHNDITSPMVDDDFDLITKASTKMNDVTNDINEMPVKPKNIHRRIIFRAEAAAHIHNENDNQNNFTDDHVQRMEPC